MNTSKTENKGADSRIVAELTDVNALTNEVQRAMEMMRRVKTSSVVQNSTAPEDNRTPSYFLPQAVMLCLPSE